MVPLWSLRVHCGVSVVTACHFHTAVAETATVDCFVLSRANFEQALGSLAVIIERASRARNEQTATTMRVRALQTLKFSEIKVVAPLGAGTFQCLELGSFPSNLIHSLRNFQFFFFFVQENPGFSGFRVDHRLRLFAFSFEIFIGGFNGHSGAKLAK